MNGWNLYMFKWVNVNSIFVAFELFSVFLTRSPSILICQIADGHLPLSVIVMGLYCVTSAETTHKSDQIFVHRK